MEKLDDIYPKTESAEYLFDAFEKRLGPPEKYYDDGNESSSNNLVLQLGTNDPSRLQTCVEHTIQRYNNIKEINLNCGCPAIESGGASTYGASLMKDAELTGKLVESVRKGLEGSGRADLPDPGISVKCRIAVFENDSDMRPLVEDDYNYLKEYISTIHDAGANHVILHARPAILSGLSPVKNRIVPKLDYEFVEKIASEFKGKVDITLNGGITSLSQLQSLQENSNSNGGSSAISSYMAGRWCLRRPLDLIGVEALLKREKLDSTTSSSLSLIQNAIEQYVDDAVKTGSLASPKYEPTLAELCLPLFLIVEQLKDDYEYDEDEDEIGMKFDSIERPSLTYDEIESLYDVLRDGVAQIDGLSKSGRKKKKENNSNNGINFKRLSSSFKSLVGTKVANKWKRNRAEL